MLVFNRAAYHDIIVAGTPVGREALLKSHYSFCDDVEDDIISFLIILHISSR